MKLLNLGCGNVRPPAPWVNVDDLYAVLRVHPTGDAAIAQLEKETNYVNHDLTKSPYPWESEEFDGILASHFFEHFTTPQAIAVMAECKRLLKPGGCLRVAVPDASYFKAVHPNDRRANWDALFEAYNDESSAETYMQVALFFEQHLQTYTHDALWCQLVQAGFNASCVNSTSPGVANRVTTATHEMASRDNRPKFSLFMEAYK